MNKFKVGQIVKQKGDPYTGRLWKVLKLNGNGCYDAKVMMRANDSDYRAVGEIVKGAALDNACEPTVKAKPFRALNGRFSKRKKVTVFIREIRVVPVEVDAANVEDALTIVREGGGDYQNDKAEHSDLDASEHFDLFGEREPIVE